MAASVLRYRGYSNKYLDIASRPDGANLGLSVEYAIHPSGFGAFIIRFVAHGDGVGPATKFSHLTYRQEAKFVTKPSEGQISEVFHGIRLNKIGVQVFNTPVPRYDLGKYGDKFGVWSLLEEWIAEQAQAEGFTVNVSLKDEIRQELVAPAIPEDAVKCVIEFPNLAAPEQKAAALKLVQKPAPDEDEDDDDNDDEDENDKDDEKPDWLN